MKIAYRMLVAWPNYTWEERTIEAEDGEDPLEVLAQELDEKGTDWITMKVLVRADKEKAEN